MADPTGRRSERGAVLVLMSLLITGLMVMAAIVVDLGHMRGMRRANQSAVDMAALAAGEALGADTGPDGPEACRVAIRYLRLNASGLSDLDGLDCDVLPTDCSLATPPVAINDTSSSYTVTITYPVSDSSISDPSVTGTGGLRTEDRQPCDRMKIEVGQTAATFFAGVAGWNELSSSASAVVRQISADDRRIPSLWMLEPYGCDVLTASGGSQVTVGTPLAALGGLISLDSDGTTCSGNSTTIVVGGSGTKLQAIPQLATPPARIALYAMAPGQMTCGDGNPRACNPSDVDNGSLSPQPTRRTLRSTRAPVDHAYNCRPFDGPKNGVYPDYHGLPIPPCTTTSGDYIDQLRAAVGTSGVPAGFNRWSSHYGCKNPANLPAALTGNWVVDCPAGFELSGDTSVVFNGGNIVFDGDIKMSGGSLTFNQNNPVAHLPENCLRQVTGCLDRSSAEAAWVYMRAGDIVLTGGAINIHHAVVYQHNGYFRIAGGSPPVWSAPTEGPFTSLAVWSEQASSRFRINGGASMELTGVFFTPEANSFVLTGGSPLLPQKAQFIARRAAISGGGTLTLAPLDTQVIVIPAPPPLLIR